MKALKIIGIIIGVAIGLFLIAGLIAPKDYDTKRSTVVNAPEEVVYKNIATFEGFNKWNPFSKMDSTQTTKVEGTDGTVGAVYSWEGKKTGKGSMTAAKLETNKSADYDMIFYTGMGEMKSIAYMQMEPAEGGQKVTWGIKGSTPYPWNAFSLFMNMENSMGPIFEQGLVSFKEVSEAEKGSIGAAYEVQETDWTGKTCLATDKKTMGAQEISAFLEENYPKIGATIGKAGAKQGMPLAVYYSWDDKAMRGELQAAIPYEGAKGGKIVSKEFSNLDLPASKAYRVDYYGWYDKMMPAYDALTAKMNSIGVQHPDLTIEEYVNDPMTEKDTAKLHTVIYYIVKQPVAAK